MHKFHQLLDRFREEPDKVRFLLSRALWTTGLCRLITFGFPAGYRMRFYPSSISAGLWRHRHFRCQDVDFVGGYLQPGETFVDVGANVRAVVLHLELGDPEDALEAVGDRVREGFADERGLTHLFEAL